MKWPFARVLLVSRLEAEREVAKLTDEQQDTLEDAVQCDPWAFGLKVRAMHAEAVRRGWLLGPA
jgi:hypothetical protein